MRKPRQVFPEGARSNNEGLETLVACSPGCCCSALQEVDTLGRARFNKFARREKDPFIGGECVVFPGTEVVDAFVDLSHHVPFLSCPETSRTAFWQECEVRSQKCRWRPFRMTHDHFRPLLEESQGICTCCSQCVTFVRKFQCPEKWCKPSNWDG